MPLVASSQRVQPVGCKPTSATAVVPRGVGKSREKGAHPDRSTKGRGIGARLMWSLVIGLQAIAALLTPLADARAESRSADGIAHVESATTDVCVAVHDHDSCQLCRTVQGSFFPAPPHTLPPGSSYRGRAFRHAALVVREIEGALPQARAPPSPLGSSALSAAGTV